MKGLKKAETPEEIAKKKDVPLEDVIRQLEMGVKVEKEHTTDEDIARQIALHHLEELPTKYYSLLKKMEKDAMNEDLRNWFNPKHPDGGWKRINSKGEVVGPCARGSSSEPKPKCMSNKKRKQLSKKRRAAAVRAKRKHDPVADRAGKGGKPVNVSNFGKGRISESMEYLTEKNVPTNPELWSKAKSLARSKFDVYPSAYANGWAAKWYKKHGGGWKKGKKVNEAIAYGIYDRTKRVFLQSNDPNAPGPVSFTRTADATANLMSQPNKDNLIVKSLTSGEQDVGTASQAGLVIPTAQAGAEIGGNVSNLSESLNFFNRMQYKKLIGEDHAAIESGEMIDDEGQMAANQLDTIQHAIERLRDKIRGKKQQLPAWVQSKITKATDGIDTVADYMSSDAEEELNENNKDITTPPTGLRGLITKIKLAVGLREDVIGSGESPAEYKARLLKMIDSGIIHKMDHHDRVHGALAYIDSIRHHYEGSHRNINLVVSGTGTDGGAKIGFIVHGISSKGKHIIAQPAAKGAAGHPRLEHIPIGNTTGLQMSSYANLRPDHRETLRDLMNFRPRKKITENFKLLIIEKAKEKPYKGFKKGKNHPEGGLSRAEARRQGIHAGIETKREAQKKGGFGKLSGKTQKRRKSFCSRMCGMKRRRTSAKTARDPKSKINAALRVWGCRCESYNPTCDVCEHEKQLLMHEEVVNKRNKGTMTKAEIKNRDEKAKGIKPQPIKGDTDDESRHRIATYITLRARGGAKKKKKAKK